jgi:hypothetical protein
MREGLQWKFKCCSGSHSVLGLSLLDNGLHALGHCGRRSADAVGHEEVFEALQPDVKRCRGKFALGRLKYEN